LGRGREKEEREDEKDREKSECAEMKRCHLLLIVPPLRLDAMALFHRGFYPIKFTKSVHGRKIVNMKKYQKKDLLAIDTPKDLLITLLVVGGVTAALSISPAVLAPAFVFKAFKKEKAVKKKYMQSAYYLKRHRLLTYSSDMKKIHLTKKGVARAARHLLAAFSQRNDQQTNRQWDGKWRLFMYDIPAKERIKRDAMRDVIKRIGMTPLQKSVWIYPFDCAEEISLIKKIFSLDDNKARLLVVADIGNDKHLRKQFKV